MYRMGRAACLWMRSAASSVVLVSFASSGETSMETQPSNPAVRSNTGRNKSAARRRSSSANSTNSSSPFKPACAFWRMPASYAAVLPMASSKMVGFDVRPVTDSSSM